MRPTYRILWLFLILFAFACSPKVTTPATLPPTRPFLEFQPQAVRMLHAIAEQKELGGSWWVRLEVFWEPTPIIEVQIDAKGPRPDDFKHEVSGLFCIMPESQKVYLKGAYVELIQVPEGIRFDVTFPNRDDRDVQQAGEWLRTEKAKRKK